MASILFPSGKRSLLQSPIDFTNNNVAKVSLHDASITIDSSFTNYSQLTGSEIIAGGYTPGGKLLGSCTILEGDFESSLVLPPISWETSSITGASYAVISRADNGDLIAAFELEPSVESVLDTFTVSFPAEGSIALSNESTQLVSTLIRPDEDRYGYSNMAVEVLHFERELVTGHFITGEPWIYIPRRPVAVTNIFAEGRVPGTFDGFFRNGYMLDPVGDISGGQSFDGSMRLTYTPPPALPIVIDPAVSKVRSLVCSSSRRNAGNTAYLNDALPQLNRVAVFTFITDLSEFGVSTPEELSTLYRPSYCGTVPTNGSSTKVGVGLNQTYSRSLSNVSRPAALNPQEISQSAERLKGTFLDNAISLNSRSLHALDNGQTFGKDIAIEHNTACLAAHIRSEDFDDFDQGVSIARTRTIQSIIQRAIDIQGSLNNGGQFNLRGNASTSAGRYFPLVIAEHLTNQGIFSINNTNICELDQTFITANDNVIGTGLVQENPDHQPISYAFEDSGEYEWFRGSKNESNWNTADNQFEAPYRRNDGYGPSLFAGVLSALFCNSNGLGLEAFEDFRTLASYTWRYWNYATVIQSLRNDPVVISGLPYYSEYLDIFSRDASNLYQIQSIVQPNNDWSTAEPGVFDFYVSTTGNDSNDGLSPATAWRTITHALNNTPLTGASVGVFGGTYNGITELAPRGRTGFLEIAAVPGETVTVGGLGINYSDSTEGDAYIRLRDLTIRSIDNLNVCFLDSGHRVEIIDCIITSNREAIEGSGVDGFDITNCDFFLLQGCKVTGVYRTMTIIGCLSPIIRGNLLRPEGGTGIQYRNMKAGGTGLIERNHIWGQDFPAFGTDPDAIFDPHASIISFRDGNVIVRQNHMHGMGSSAGCMFYTQDAAGGRPRYDNVLFENNAIYDVSNRYVFRVYNQGSNFVVRNNLFGSRFRTDSSSPCPGQVTEVIQYKYHQAVTVHTQGPGEDGSGFRFINNICVGTCSIPGAAFERNNIVWAWNVTGQTSSTSGTSIVVVSAGPGTCTLNPYFRVGFFKDIYDPFEWVNTRNLYDFSLANNSPAINFGYIPEQAVNSLGSVGPDGLLRDDGPMRSSTAHSVGPYEVGGTGISN